MYEGVPILVLVLAYGTVPALVLVGYIILIVRAARKPKNILPDETSAGQAVHNPNDSADVSAADKSPGKSQSTAKKVGAGIRKGLDIFLIVMGILMVCVGIAYLTDGYVAQALMGMVVAAMVILFAYARLRGIV